MNLFHRLFAWNDRRRARDFLQQVCEDRVEARRKLDELDRKVDQAMRDAQRLNDEHFRESYFGKRDPIQSGFVEGSAKLFGIIDPTMTKVSITTLEEIPPTKYRVWRNRQNLIRHAEAA